MRNRLLISLLGLSSLASFSLTFKNLKDVPYNPDYDRCILDIYAPDSVQSDLPVIIWFHGGGLTDGEKFIPEQLKTGEFIVVSPNYRLLQNATIDDCIDDAAHAISWAMDSIDKYGGNPNLVFVSGHSAGGYLSSMVGLDKKWLKKYGKDPDKIAGLIPFSGQVITHFAQRQKNGISELTPAIDEYAPIFYISKDAPPYVIVTGDREMELYGRYEENAYMYRMLKLMGHPYVYIYEINGYNHGDMDKPAYHILKNHVKDIINHKKESEK